MTFLHYILTILLITIATFIFALQNPVHSVLLLILSFFISAIILLMLGIEFVGLLFIMVYVGAVAVLFLFVVMMINTKKSIKQEIPLFKYLLIKFFSLLIFFKMDSFLNSAFFNNTSNNVVIQDFNFSILNFDSLTNIELIAQALFNNYNDAVLLAGLVLLIALIGCIYLTIPFKNIPKLNEQKQSRTNSINMFKPKKLEKQVNLMISSN